MKEEYLRKQFVNICSDNFENIPSMTEIQRRRVDLLNRGLSINEIAIAEGVKRSAVYVALEGAMVRIRKYRSKG